MRTRAIPTFSIIEYDIIGVININPFVGVAQAACTTPLTQIPELFSLPSSLRLANRHD